MRFFDKLLLSPMNRYFHLIASLQKKKFAKCGRDVFVGNGCSFIESHIYLGDHIYIGEHASFMAAVANIYIDDYVVFGPNVTIRGGDHRTDVIGSHIIEVREKLPENDLDVKIESGVWVGCNVTILKGVTIGRGAVVAAGALVVSDVLAYSVVGGIPAKLLKMRFTPEQIIEHEKILTKKGKMT